MSPISFSIREQWARRELDSLGRRCKQFGIISSTKPELATLTNRGVCGVRGDISSLLQSGAKTAAFAPLPVREPHWGYSLVVKAWHELSSSSEPAKILLMDNSHTNEHASGIESDDFMKWADKMHGLKADQFQVLRPADRLIFSHRVAGVIQMKKLTRLLGERGVNTVLDVINVTDMAVALLWGQHVVGVETLSIVVVGVHEIPFAELTVQVARRLGIREPTFIFLGSLPGLRGQARMSGGDPESTVLWRDGVDTKARKIKSAKSSSCGRNDGISRALQCVLLQCSSAALPDGQWDEMALSCGEGLDCRTCKERLIKRLC